MGGIMAHEIAKKETLIDRIMKAGGEVGPTFRTAWPYVLLGFFIAGFLLGLQLTLMHFGIVKENSLASRIMEHVGVGFLVSAIAVFGYEWSSHINDTLEAREGMLKSSGKLTAELNRIHGIQDLVGRASVLRGLDEIFKDNGEDFQKIKEQFGELIDVLQGLSSRDGSKYLPFIPILFNDLLLDNAKALVEIGRDKGNADHHFKVDPVACAAKLLTVQMESMNQGDEYHVLSDVASWKGNTLVAFHKATLDATRRGVIIRRVFNLAHDEMRLSLEDVAAVLRQHFHDSTNSPLLPNGERAYEIRFVLEKRALEDEDSREVLDVANQHFGLFLQGDSLLYFDVRRGFSDYLLSRRPRPVVEEGEDPYSFLRIWGEADPIASESMIDSLADRWRGAQRNYRSDAVQNLLAKYSMVQSGHYATLFGSLAEEKIHDLENDLQQMTGPRPSYRILQLDPVQYYIKTFVQLMREIILENSEFCVVTNELIWAKNSFGRPDKRYLKANVAAAKDRGIKIRRIFVIESPTELRKDPGRTKEILKMLGEHEEAFKGIKDVEMLVYCPRSDEEYALHFGVRDDLDLDGSDNFAIWKVKADKEICTLVEYKPAGDGKGYRINSIRFDSSPEVIKDKKFVFDDMRSRAMSLREFINAVEEPLAQAV